MNKITKIIITALIFTIVSTLTVYLLMIVFNKLTIPKENNNVVNKKVVTKDTVLASKENTEIELLKKEIELLKKDKEVEIVEDKKALNDEIIKYTTQVQFYILNNNKKSLKKLNSKLLRLNNYFAIKGLDNNTNRLLRISIKSVRNEINSIKKASEKPKNKRKIKDTNENKNTEKVDKKDTIIKNSKPDIITEKKTDTTRNLKKDDVIKKDTIVLKKDSAKIKQDTLK